MNRLEDLNRRRVRAARMAWKRLRAARKPIKIDGEYQLDAVNRAAEATGIVTTILLGVRPANWRGP